MQLDIRCPACGHQGVVYNATTTDIPYFGECMDTLILCGACGFKHTEVFILGQKEPVRYRYRVQGEADLFTRVVRGSSCTIRIPELGVVIEPGPISEAFVSNVEGVLNRVLAVLGQLTRSGEDHQKAGAHALIGRIEAAKSGGENLTLILEDPFGNSAIVHPDVDRQVLSPEEAGKLKTGMTLIDIDDIEPTDDDDDDRRGGGLDVDELLRP